MTDLVKNTRFTYTPGTPGYPPRPGYTAWELYYVCGSAVQGGSYQYIMDDDGVWRYVLVADDPGAGTSLSSYGYECSLQSVPVYHPPEPGVPPVAAVLTYDYNLGWNSGARSLKFFANDGYAEYKVSPSLVGAVTGLNDVDLDAGYGNISHAFYLSGKVARIMERGVDKLYIGAYAAGDVFKIERRRGTVSYRINDVLVYTSATASAGVAFLDASLYCGGDYIEDAAIAGYSATGSPPGEDVIDGALNFRPLALSAGETGAASSGGTLAFSPLTMASSYFQGGTQALRPLLLQGSETSYGAASLSLAPLTVESHPGELVPSFALGAMSFVGLTTSGLCLTGEIGGGSPALHPLGVLGGRAGYGEARLSLAPMATRAGAFEGNLQASMFTIAASRPVVSTFGAIDVRLISDVVADDSYLTLVLANAVMAENVSAGQTMSYSATMQALMASVAQVTAGVPTLSLEGEVWVVNDSNGASTSYEGYSFNSFAKYQGRYLAAKADGVYLLGGDTDAGAPIRASISLGKQDFGTTAMKTVSGCYIGVAASGDIYLKVLANNTSYLYKTVRSDDYLRAQRVTLGRGLRANYLTFELYNEAGADFELASVEFEAAVLSRRI